MGLPPLDLCPIIIHLLNKISIHQRQCPIFHQSDKAVIKLLLWWSFNGPKFCPTSSMSGQIMISNVQFFVDFKWWKIRPQKKHKHLMFSWSPFSDRIIHVCLPLQSKWYGQLRLTTGQWFCLTGQQRSAEMSSDWIKHPLSVNYDQKYHKYHWQIW